MIDIEISKVTMQIFNEYYSADLTQKSFVYTQTKKEFEGDFTLVVFPLISFAKTNPENLANTLGNELLNRCRYISSFNVVKGFLNLKLSDDYWSDYSNSLTDESFINLVDQPDEIIIEFSSPNTNKPLHLGHIRNNLLGVSISNLLKFVGHNVTRVSLLNDRGIHVCKSMLAWEEWGNKLTPALAGKKGDHLIGDFYVLFDKKYKEEINALVDSGLTKEEAAKQSELMAKAQKLLKKWERGKKEVIDNWKLLNSWVIDGFNETYKKLGVEFDKIYYESETYLKGKDIVLKELSKGNVKLNEDGSAFIDLSDSGLDEKILLRSDGTSVYITQDIGTAVERYKEYTFDKQIYVVGNEQIYHFKVLKEVLKRFGFDWSDKIEHYSYGMVELPEGKMKSREGTVVDADDLIQEMYDTALEKTKELGKLEELSKDEVESTIMTVAMGALKYFILRVDPRKNMMFNPKESIDFNGNTGPFIQYTYTRINSLLEKGEDVNFKLLDDNNASISLLDKELAVIKEVYNFNSIVSDAAKNLNPSALANYAYSLAKLFNSFYQEVPILKAENEYLKAFRLKLSQNVAIAIKITLQILGIEVPRRM